MKYSRPFTGFVQAAGVAIYILAFAFFMQNGGQWFQVSDIPPMAGIAMFLLAFVVSALITGSLTISYPIMLFIDGKKREAFSILIWDAAWLIAFLFLFAAVAVNF